MSSVHDKNRDSAMEKGGPETAAALDEHGAATSVNATKFNFRGSLKQYLVCFIKSIIFALTLITLAVLAFQVYQDHYDYEALANKYNDLVKQVNDTNPKMARAIQATDGAHVFTSTIAPFITATNEFGISALPCTGPETSISTSMTALPVATSTSITPVGYSLVSSFAPETETATATTLDVTTVTVPRSTLTLTTTVITSSDMFTSSADALSPFLLSSSCSSSEEITTTTTIIQPATVTATLSALSSLAAELSSYPPLVSSESASETGTCAPGTTLTTTATVSVSPLSSSQPLTTTTVSVINTLTTITTVISGQQTVLVTQTLSSSGASGLSSADALSGSVSSTMAPVLGTSISGTAGATTITLTSTASNNYTVSHTGARGPSATISISGGAKGPKTLGANTGKPSGTAYCVVMIVTALVTLFI